MSQPLHQKILRPLWFLLAVLFLFEAWLWDLLGHALTRLAALIPLEGLKQALARTIDRLPAPVVLLVFLIPLGVIEPFKFLGLWLITHHHLFLGILAFVAAKVAGLGVMAFLFEMTRVKLLSMPWFERFYLWVLRIRAWAHELTEPYKLKIKEAMAPIKARLREMLAALKSEDGGLGRRLVSLRNWARRSRGLT
ncbi:MAG: hypothetical protein ACLP8A_16070 [Methylovirgula sp.]